MPGLRHVPAGRSGVLWLHHRLDVARRGGAVLRQKLTMLAGEQERHWVPRLESALATVPLRLAELEAGDAASRRAAR